MAMYKGFSLKTFFEDYKWWYQQQGPKYGYISSLYTAYFNARHFKRDGTYRIKTNGEHNK